MVFSYLAISIQLDNSIDTHVPFIFEEYVEQKQEENVVVIYNEREEALQQK